MKKIKVFISSPSDVEMERSVVMTVLNRLKRRYKEYLHIDGVFWKEKPLSAGSHFQDEIDNPSNSDIVIVILYSKLGVDLSNHYKGKVTGKQPVTGTEWEFEEAMSHYNSCGKPHIIVYKKDLDIVGVVGDNKEYERKIKEKERLDEFMRYWFINEDGTFKKAFHQFKHLKEFEDRVETHLEELMQLYLKDIIGENTRWFKGSPFRGLNSFELEHEEIFFGRREQIHQIRANFLDLISKNRPFLLIIGASGCGKSSLLKAGVLPYLLQPDVDKDVDTIRHAIFKPNDNQNDLIYSLANAIFKAFQEEFKFFGYTPNKLKEIFTKSSRYSINPIKRAINKIKERKNLIQDAKVRVVLVIDQFEEIFTNRAFLNKEREQFINLIDAFVKSGFIWVLGSMRSDFIKHTDDILKLKELLKHQDSKYLLSFPSISQTRELIVRPAYEAGLRYERKDGKGLDEVLLESMKKNGTSLPLLEYVLEELYLSRTKDNILTFEAYEKMGQIEGAIGQKAEAIYSSLALNEQKALDSLIRMLVVITDNKNIQKSAKTITYDSIKNHKDKINVIDIMCNESVRLFVKDKDSFGNILIRVAHEALFNNWKRAVEIISIAQQDIIIRQRLEKSSNDWINADKKDKKALLLNDGLPLNEALSLVDRKSDELNDNILDFVKHSQKRVHQKRWQVRGVVTASIVAIFAIYSLAQNAKIKEEQAKKSKEETEKLVDFMLTDLKNQLEPIGRVDIIQNVQKKVAQYLKTTDEQDSAKNIDESQKKLLQILQKQQESLQELQFEQEYNNIRILHQNIVKNILQDEEDSERLSVLEKRQKEIRAYFNLVGEQDTSPRSINLKAKSYTVQGEIYQEKGKSTRSLSEYQKAIRNYKELIKLEPDNSKWQKELALVYDSIGTLYLENFGDLAIALEFFQNAVEIRVKLVKESLNDNWLQFDLSTSYRNIALVYKEQGFLEKSIAFYQKSLKIRKTLSELESNNGKFKEALARSHDDIGSVYFDQYDFTKALDEYYIARDIRESLVDSYPNNNEWKKNLSVSYLNIGHVYFMQGVILKYQSKQLYLQKQFSQAEEISLKSQEKFSQSKIEYEKALKINKELVEFDPYNVNWLNNLANCYFMFGKPYTMQDDFKKAKEAYKKAQDIYTKLLIINPNNAEWLENKALSYSSIGYILGLEKRVEEAVKAYEESINIIKKLTKLDPSNKSLQLNIADSYMQIGTIYRDSKSFSKAIDSFEKALKITKVLIKHSPKGINLQNNIANSLNNMNLIYVALDQLDGVENVLKTYKWFLEFDVKSQDFQLGISSSYFNLALIEYQPEKIVTKDFIRYLQERVLFLQKLKDDGYLHKNNFQELENAKYLLNLFI